MGWSPGGGNARMECNGWESPKCLLGYPRRRDRHHEIWNSSADMLSGFDLDTPSVIVS